MDRSSSSGRVLTQVLRGAFVILVGVLATASVLGLAFVAKPDQNLLHAFASGMIPFGAIGVGVIAGIASAAVAMYVNLRPNRNILVIVLLVHVLGFISLDYVNYLRRHPVDRAERPIPFIEYFDVMVRNMVMVKKERHWWQHRQIGAPLGRWGYFYYGLCVLGFSIGGLIPLGFVFRFPYCGGCELYMRNKELASFPQELPDSDNENVAMEAVELAKRQDGVGFTRVLEKADRLKSKMTGASRFEFSLSFCTQCQQGTLQLQLFVQSKRKHGTQLLCKVPVRAAFVEAVRS